MDDTEEEKVQLLESLRLQDAALSTTVDNSLVNLDSDSDSEVDTPNTQADDFRPPESEGIHLKEDDSVEEISKDPSWADALEANQEYDAVLAQLEAEIKMNISKVSQQLDEVHDKLSKLKHERTALNLKSHWVYIFGMPYFKTHDLYPCSFNEDYQLKKSNNEICWTDLPSFNQWIPRYKRVLNHAVKELSIAKCKTDAQLKLAVLRREADSAKQEGNLELAAKIEDQIKTFDIDAVIASSIDDVVANTDHDWLQISATYLEGKQPPESCRNFWYLYLHPTINKGPYTLEEEQLLSSLAVKYEYVSLTFSVFIFLLYVKI